MQEVKNQNRSHRIKNAHVKYIIQVVCLCVDIFRLPVHVDSFCLFHFESVTSYVMVSQST